VVRFTTRSVAAFNSFNRFNLSSNSIAQFKVQCYNNRVRQTKDPLGDMNASQTTWNIPILWDAPRPRGRASASRSLGNPSAPPWRSFVSLHRHAKNRSKIGPKSVRFRIGDFFTASPPVTYNFTAVKWTDYPANTVQNRIESNKTEYNYSPPSQSMPTHHIGANSCNSCLLLLEKPIQQIQMTHFERKKGWGVRHFGTVL
jgi:hypothetical protein